MIKIIIMFIIVVIFLFPYYWMLLISLEPDETPIGGEPHWFPKNITFDNYLYMFRLKLFLKWLFNSLFISGMAVGITCFSASMAGYIFAKKPFLGSKFIFALMLTTMAIPANTIILPRFLIMKDLGLINTYPSMFIMHAASVSKVFLMKQIISTVPDEIIESGMIDGASEWQIFWYLIVPIVRPGIIIIGIFTFVASYGDYFWQLLMTNTDDMKTLPLAIALFQEIENPRVQLTMAAALIASLPLLIFCLILHKYFIKGPSVGSIK